MLRSDSFTRFEKAKQSFILFFCAVVVFFIDFLLNVIRSGAVQDMDFLSWLYYIPSALGQAFLFAVILYLISFLPFFFLLRNTKVANSIFVICLIATQILLVLNTYVYSLYKFHLNGFVFSLVMGGGNEIFEFGTVVYLKFILLAFLVGVLPFLIARWLGKKYAPALTRKKILWTFFGLFLCVVYSHLGHAVAAATHHSAIRKSALAIPYFYPLTANSLLYKVGIAKRDHIDNMTYNVYSSDLQYPLEPLQADTDSLSGYNVIYLLIDSWNPRSFDEETFPNITGFARQAHTFNNHWSSSSGTRGSIFGLFFGVPYTYEKEFSISKMSPLVIDRFIELDYDIETYPSSTFKTPPFHETIYRRVPGIMTESEGTDTYERDTYITEKFTDFIENYDSDKPFFSFLFYDLMHAMNIPKEYHKFHPCWETSEYLALNNKIDPTPFFNLYRNCGYYVDTLIGDLLRLLEEKGYMENTVIIITGDHGQEFNENKRNYWGHGSNYSKWQVQVPFILYYPGMQDKGKVFPHMTTHYDVTPTVMNRFLGIQNPSSDYTVGHDMYSDASRYPHPVGDGINYGFLFDDLIVSTNHYGTLEITDKELNPQKRSALKASDLQKALTIKNKFFK